MLNVYLRTPQTDAGAWLNFPASYQTVQHLFSVLGDLLDEESNGVQGVQTRLKRKDRFESK